MTIDSDLRPVSDSGRLIALKFEQRTSVPGVTFSIQPLELFDHVCCTEAITTQTE